MSDKDTAEIWRQAVASTDTPENRRSHAVRLLDMWPDGDTRDEHPQQDMRRARFDLFPMPDGFA